MQRRVDGGNGSRLSASRTLRLGWMVLEVAVNLLTPPDVDAIVGVWIVLAETEEYELLLL